MYAREHGYDFLAQVDGDGQHESVELERLVAAMEEGAVDMVCGSRFLTNDYRYPAPISRRTGIHIFAFAAVAHRRHARQRPDLRLSPVQPPRDRAVRARLPARLPRGRGGADAPPPPPADARDAGEDVHPRRRHLVDQHRQVRLLHGQGAAGAARRPGAPPRAAVVEPRRPRAGQRRAARSSSTCRRESSWWRSSARRCCC